MNAIKTYLILIIFLSQSIGYTKGAVELPLAIRELKSSLADNRVSTDELNVIFSGAKFPIFYKFESPWITMVIRDPVKKSSLNFSTFDWFRDCFFFKADLDKKLAKIDLINSKPTGCPIPAEKRGTFIMALSEELLKHLDIRNSSIVDASEVECPKADVSTSLSLLRVMQRGSTWYENFGYEPDVRYPYKKNIDFLRNFPISRLPEEIENNKEGVQQASALAEKYLQDEYEEYLDNFDARLGILKSNIGEFSKISVSVKLSDFLTWVWSKDCSDYIAIKNLIFPPKIIFDKNKSSPSWWTDYSQFESSLSTMKKTIYPKTE